MVRQDGRVLRLDVSFRGEEIEGKLLLEQLRNFDATLLDEALDQLADLRAGWVQLRSWSISKYKIVGQKMHS